MSSIHDYFMFATGDSDTRSLTTTVTAKRRPGEKTLSCLSVSSLPTSTPVAFITYREETDEKGLKRAVDKTSMIGLVSAANNEIVELTIAPGFNDIGNNPGDIIKCVPTGLWSNKLIGGILTSLSPDGTIRPNAVSKKQIKEKSIAPTHLNPEDFPMFSATTSKWIALEKTNDNNPKWNKAQYNVVDYNIGNMYDSNSFTATVLKNGIYHIDARVGISETGFFSTHTACIGIFKNDKLIKESTRTKGTDNALHIPRPSLSADLLLKENDKIDIRAFCTDQRRFGGDSVHSEFNMRFIIGYEK